MLSVTPAPRISRHIAKILGSLFTCLIAASAFAQQGATNSHDEAAELAKKLSNPVADLISVPFQSNFEFGGGPNGDGFRYLMNFQPVIPISLNKDWNLISRTILPIIDQNDLIGTTSQAGLGDTTQSFFFSPKKPTRSG
jgi:hypothetical protein